MTQGLTRLLQLFDQSASGRTAFVRPMYRMTRTLQPFSHPVPSEPAIAVERTACVEPRSGYFFTYAVKKSGYAVTPGKTVSIPPTRLLLYATTVGSQTAHTAKAFFTINS